MEVALQRLEVRRATFADPLLGPAVVEPVADARKLDAALPLPPGEGAEVPPPSPSPESKAARRRTG